MIYVDTPIQIKSCMNHNIAWDKNSKKTIYVKDTPNIKFQQ